MRNFDAPSRSRGRDADGAEHGSAGRGLDGDGRVHPRRDRADRPGTGTPNANVVAGYKENATDYYIAPFNLNAQLQPVCTSTNGCTLTGINYPAQFWPIPLPGWGGLSGAKWNDSTGQGILALDTQLQLALPAATPQNPVIIFGYSQGGNIVSREKATLSGLTDAQKASLAFVMIGNTNRPNGGLFERLAFLGTVPILDVTFGLAGTDQHRHQDHRHRLRVRRRVRLPAVPDQPARRPQRHRRFLVHPRHLPGAQREQRSR